MAFGLKLRKMSTAERERVIDGALDLVDMRGFKQAGAKNLSGGETQRIALARALALDPSVFLCDEPTASVDLENQASIVSLLQRINREKGITVLFTTHDRQLASHLAHETVVLTRGRIARTGYDNVFSCSLVEGEGKKKRLRLNGSLELLVPDNEQEIRSGRQRIWIDPASLIVHNGEQPEATANRCSGTLVQLNADPHGIRAVIDVGVPLTALLDREQYERLQPVIGGTLHIEVPPQGTRLL
jgi:tungstate transport system ATP-binding protein